MCARVCECVGVVCVYVCTIVYTCCRIGENLCCVCVILLHTCHVNKY